MFKTLNRFARRVAAIDEKMIKECPRHDKIWATHIGYMLIFTFVILIAITYFSIDYFNGAKIVFDIDTNMMKLKEGEWSVWSVFAGAAIAFVIAGIIFMFDRAVFQSDWFVQTPYEIPEDSWQSFKRGIAKVFRITIRLSISIAIAFALSTFLELRMYESQIIEVMHVDHLDKNKKIYNQIKQYSVDADKEIERKTKEKDVLQQRLNTIMSSSAPWMMDENIMRLDRQSKHDKKVYQKSLDELKAVRLTELAPMQKRLKKLNIQKDGIVKELDTAEMKQQAEEYGIDTMSVSGMQIKASGRRGDGVRSKMLKKRIQQIRRVLADKDEKIEITKNELQIIKAKHTNRLNILEKEYVQAIINYRKTKNDYIAQAKQVYKVNEKQNRSDMESTLNETSISLSELTESRQRRINNYTQMMLKSPQFIPMRDGPIVRLMALKKFSRQGETGEEIWLFSWMVKAFIIFLEVVPVLAKMFFSPPSVYAVMLQMQVRSRVKDIFDNKGTGSSQAIKEQIRLEKMRIKLNHLRNQRIVSDELNPQGVREHMKHKRVSIKKDAA